MRTHPFAFALSLLLLVPACETVIVPPPEELDLWQEASAGVENTSLQTLSKQVWDAELRWDPFQATMLGDPRFNGEIPYRAQQSRLSRIAELTTFRRRAGGVAEEKLSENDRITRELLIQKLDDEIAVLRLGLDDWNVDSLEGPHVRMLALTNVQPRTSARERAQLVERWEKFPAYVRQNGINLTYGKAAGKVASQTSVEKVISQLRELLEIDPMDSPLVQVATGGGTWVRLEANGSVAAIAHEHLGDARKQRELRQVNLHLQDGERLVVGTRVLLPADDDELTPVERGKFLNAVFLAVEQGIYPALAGYKDLLLDEILPIARSDEEPGLSSVKGGEHAYRTLIRYHTSLPEDECDPQAIHDFGLAEVQRIRSEISALGLELFQTTDVSVVQQRLRGDPELHFETREQVEAKAVEALHAAEARMHEYFGITPEAACEIVRIPSHEEKDTTIAYYRAPAADGSRPGRYFINTYRPETRPRYEAEVLAYHEAIPGHHLQIAIAQELENLPLFRRHGGSTAFVEGWALYTERLCDEMGLYSGDVDRMGVLSYDAWRASRLVVDTGIHAFGWSRQRAIEYLYENTLLARNNVENEIDRYIAWPGQALAYKIGQREILTLREEARDRLGAAFSYPEFHDRILENGAVTLATLRGVIDRWLGSGATN